MRSLLLILLCGYAYSHTCSNNPYIKDAGPLVRTNSGAVVGKYEKVFDTDVAAFLGIPYAEPPINEKRFQKPKPCAGWPGILEATKKPHPCMQYSSRDFSWIPRTTTPKEDCLYLNIWAPSKCCCSGEDKLPVLVWIYGGGFYSGSTDMHVYDGSTLAAYSKAIVVSINYRVGVFGFLNSGNNEAPGNAGLLDQNLALKWVKSNINNFGGDESRITIMGESAGAISVSLHMISPMSRDLFSRAILHSATAYHPLMVDSAEVSFIKANNFAKTLGCLSDNSSIESDLKVVECLRSKDSHTLALTEDIFTSKFPLYFLPTYKNEFLPVEPIKAINEGHVAPADVLIGNTKDEASIFLNYIIPDVFKLHSEPQLNLEAAKNIIGALFQPVSDPQASEIFQQYFQNLTDNDSSEIVQTIVEVYGDYVFNCPVKFFAEKTGNAFVYWFTHRSTGERYADWVGVPHFYEVPFVFGVPIHDTNKYTPEDGRFSCDLIQKWAAFAQRGRPAVTVDWPKFTTDDPRAFDLNSRHGKVLPYPRTSACEFWRPYLSQK